jgi:hypothetical protein
MIHSHRDLKHDFHNNTDRSDCNRIMMNVHIMHILVSYHP